MSRRPLFQPVRFLAAIALFSILAMPVLAMPVGSEGWTVLQGEAGVSVDYPSALFPVDAGPTEKGKGKKFRSADGKSEFAVYSLANTDKDSPAAYLRKNLIVSPQSMIYRRVAPDFFAMSSIREGRIFYSRCNFAMGIHCIYIEYPQDAKRAFDSVVTRVSHSLRPR
jgi:hypothetical protein